MSKTRFIVSNRNIEAPVVHRKCSHHVNSHNYITNMQHYETIMAQTAGTMGSMANPDANVNIKMAVHFLAPIGSYNADRVTMRTHDVVLSLNDDFNNYSLNPNTMNNFKYKSIINQVFLSNMAKQNIYLNKDYTKILPTRPSNITFELGQVYYYPVRNHLNLASYDDDHDVEIQHQVIKQYIHQNQADAIDPNRILNMWVVDMSGTSNLGYSNFPWEMKDKTHGIIISRRAFFPEDYPDTTFTHYKTFTHHVGHYLGLVHVINQNSLQDILPTGNLNLDSEIINNGINRLNTAVHVHVPIPIHAAPCAITLHSYDPTDRVANKMLHYDCNYNPLFMNFMDYTHDKYVSMFTQNQIQTMKNMICAYRPDINSITSRVRFPTAVYNPDTDTIVGAVGCASKCIGVAPVPAIEATNNPRLAAHGIYVSPNQTQQLMDYSQDQITHAQEVVHIHNQKIADAEMQLDHVQQLHAQIQDQMTAVQIQGQQAQQLGQQFALQQAQIDINNLQQKQQQIQLQMQEAQHQIRQSHQHIQQANQTILQEESRAQNLPSQIPLQVRNTTHHLPINHTQAFNSILTPNLSLNNLTPHSIGETTEEQIIANIQNTLPPPHSHCVPCPETNAYDTFINNYQTYNSAEGYATHYPYDPYTAQQYNSNMTLIQEHYNNLDTTTTTTTTTMPTTSTISTVSTSAIECDKPIRQRKKRVDPQMQAIVLDIDTNEIENKIIHKHGGDINHDALDNLRSLQNLKHRRINKRDIVPIHFDDPADCPPSNSVIRVNDNNSSTDNYLVSAAITDNKNRVSRCATNTNTNTKMRAARHPMKKFVRTKPLNMHI